MPSLAPPAELLRALSQALAELGVGWYLFGAQAVLYWGRPRFTEDIDITVQLGALDPERLVARLNEAGFVLRVEATPAFIAETRVLPFAFRETGWALDTVLGGPGLEEEFLGRSVRVNITPELDVPVISAEDLVVTKVLAARPKDIDDIRGVLTAQAGRFDTGLVRRTLEMLEAALGVSDLVPVFEKLRAAAEE